MPYIGVPLAEIEERGEAFANFQISLISRLASANLLGLARLAVNGSSAETPFAVRCRAGVSARALVLVVTATAAVALKTSRPLPPMLVCKAVCKRILHVSLCSLRSRRKL
jgi:hypothetical protein